MKIHLKILSLACVWTFLAISVAGTNEESKTLLYLPLDERFTTRDLFLSFSEIKPFRVLTPEKAMLPKKKLLPDAKALLDWTVQKANSADAAIISADMLFYGGLIASRTSSDSVSTIRERLKVLEEIRRKNPRLPIFVSTTVMRMPQYNSAEEEPDYYAQYGRTIFLFSEHSHRYEVLKNEADKIAAENYQKQIPKEVLDDYLARRERNFSVNKELIELVRRKVIDRLVITLDDNAEYGLFKKEAATLEKLAADLNARIAIYPGADEAQLPLLSRLVLNERRVPVFIAYRFPEAKRLIPAFEGQPLEESVKQQVLAAGGEIVAMPNEAECILYVNNFTGKQTFAGTQFGVEPEETAVLSELLAKNRIKFEKGKIYILADNRFYNGSDVGFVRSIFADKIRAEQIAYAGWNTSGNTLGTAVAMGILRARIGDAKTIAGKYKKMLWARFVEDWAYMVDGREELKKDMKRRNVTTFAGTALETEYEAKMKTLLNEKARVVNRFLGTNYLVGRAYFPWHRQFEIGFEIAEN